MSLVIFISGLLESNSGKTYFAKQLIRALVEDYSINVIPFKPLSGNNIFYHYDKIRDIVSRYGQLLSLDAIELLSATSHGSDLDPLLINPVHQLHTQALGARFYNDRHLDVFITKYLDSIPLVQRFSFYENESISSIYIVNNPIFNNEKFFVPKEQIQHIFESAELIFYNTELEYYSLNQKYYANAVQSTFSYLKKRFKAIVIESFNNSAHPAWCVREANVVLMVGPGTLFVFDPQEYFRVIDHLHLINNLTPTKTHDVVKLLKPKEVFELPIGTEKLHKELRALINTLLSFS